MFLTISLTISALLQAAPEASPIGGDYGEPHMIVAAPENPRYAHLSWPKVTRCNDGTLVLAYSAGRYHGEGGEGCPAVSLSTDRGQTFTKPQVLMEFTKDGTYDNCGNIALGVAPDGAVVMLAMAYRGNEANTIIGWRSVDSGKSWTPVDVSALDNSKTGSVFGHIFEVPGRGLAVCGHYRAGSQPRSEGIWIAYSQDNGQSWGTPHVITDKKLFEPTVVFSGDRFVGLFRQSGRAPFFWQAVSDDLGKSWNLSQWPEKPAPDHNLPSPFIAVSPKDPHGLYALESQRHVKGSLPGNIYLWTADSRRLDWKRTGLVVRFPESLGDHNDFSYPWMTPLDDDTWFLAFYCGKKAGANSIYGMTLRPDQPTQTVR
jgi:BNR repeat protein